MNTEMDRIIPPAGPEMEKTVSPEPPSREPDSGIVQPDSPGETSLPTETEPAVPPSPESPEEHPRRRRRAARPADESGTETDTEEAPEQSGIPEEFYPLDRCCICNHPLDTGCAVLFTDAHGMARIDEICCKSLEVAARSMDQAEVARAFDYFAAWVPYVKPPVADYLRNYLRVVQSFLNA